MHRRLAVLVSAFLLAGPAALSAKPFVVVTEEKQGDQVSLYATLQNASCVSFEMTLTLTNMKSSAPLPIVRDLTQERTLLTTLTKINPAEKWAFKYRFRPVVGRSNAKPDLAHVYKLPFNPESKFPLRSGYGGRAEPAGSPPTSTILVWDMPEGTPVLAAREGTVVGIRDDSNEHGLSDEFHAKANVIVIEHADGTLAEYVHLKYQGVAVKLGQAVKTGELIGYSGNTGFTRTPNLLVRISRVNPAATRESLAAIWDTKDASHAAPGHRGGQGHGTALVRGIGGLREMAAAAAEAFPADRRTIMSALFISIIDFALRVWWRAVGGNCNLCRPSPRGGITEHHQTGHRPLATLTALVLGLLVGSVRKSFDTPTRTCSASPRIFVLLDRILGNYGPAATRPAGISFAKPPRPGMAHCHQGQLIARHHRQFHGHGGHRGRATRMLRELPTKNRADELLPLRALEVSSKLAQTPLAADGNFRTPSQPIPCRGGRGSSSSS